MSIEFDFNETSLCALVARFARRALRTACLPVAVPDTLYVDHVDVVDGQVQVVQEDGGIRVRVPCHVYIVTHGALLAAPNGVPAGAVVSPLPVSLSYAIEAQAEAPAAGEPITAWRSFLILRPKGLGPGSLGDLPEPARGRIQAALLEALPEIRLALSAHLRRIGLAAPRTADVVHVAGTVCARFDPDQGPPHARLAPPAQEWGLFIGGGPLVELARSVIASRLQEGFQGMNVEAHWHPQGADSHIALRASIEMDIQGGFLGIEASVTVRAWADITCRLSLAAPDPDAAMRLTVDWSFHLDTPLGGAIEGVAEDIAESTIADAMDPARFGGVRTGARQFVIDRPLDAMGIAGARLLWGSLAVQPDGVTLGGKVLPPPLWEPPFQLEGGSLGKPTRLQLCSVLAKSGSGEPSREPLTLENTFSQGMASLSGIGRLCGVDVLHPPFGLDAFVHAEHDGDQEHARIQVKIPYEIAQTMNAPLRCIVRTPRGVRLVDMGMAPKAELDSKGVVTNGMDIYIPNCLYIDESGIAWGKLLAGGEKGDVIDLFKPPPLEDPDWSVFLRQRQGLSIQLLTISDLIPGEMLRFRSSSHAIDVSAGPDGQVVVPAFIALDAVVQPAALARLNRQSLKGRVDVRTLDLQTLGVFPGTAAQPRLAFARDGSALLRRRAGKRDIVDVLRVGARRQAAEHAAPAEINPQPLPPGSRPGDALADMSDIAALLPMPGLHTRRAAIAVRHDGSKLLLNRNRDGAWRVAGSFRGPIGTLSLQDGLALAGGASDVVVSQVS